MYYKLQTCSIPKGVRAHPHLGLLRGRHLGPVLVLGGGGPEEGLLPLLHHLLLRRLLRVQPILREHFTLLNRALLFANPIQVQLFIFSLILCWEWDDTATP